MAADDRITDGDGTHLILVRDTDHFCRAEIRTRAAADATAFDGHHQAAAALFFHLQGTSPYRLLTDPDTEPAADTSVRHGTHIDTVLPGQLANILGLGCHVQQFQEGLGSSLVHQRATGLHDHLGPDLENAREHVSSSLGFADHLHRTEFA